jgi:hypothetical protein
MDGEKELGLPKNGEKGLMPSLSAKDFREFAEFLGMQLGRIAPQCAVSLFLRDICS